MRGSGRGQLQMAQRFQLGLEGGTGVCQVRQGKSPGEVNGNLRRHRTFRDVWMEQSIGDAQEWMRPKRKHSHDVSVSTAT